MLLQAYRLLVWSAVGPVFAYLWWRGRRDPAYRQRWRERLGFAGSAPLPPGGIVLHCASVGEVIAARPLVERLLRNPTWGPVTLTCTTPTGSDQIRRDFGQRVGHCYFPIDLPGATRRFLAHARPRLVLLMEREVWPGFLHQAQCQGVPVALVNARLSELSAAGYQRWKSLMAPALGSLRMVCAEDADTTQRMRAMGVPAQRLQTTGNIKSDVQASPALLLAINALRPAFSGRPVLAAGSTHAGEDEALVKAFQRHLQRQPDALLILAPRHPERFAAVAELLAASGLRHVRRSQGQSVARDTQVLLGDTMGELMLWYGVADACFIGGSLVPRGGHNPLEALCLDKPVLTGPHTANFDTLFRLLQDAQALGRTEDAHAVFEQWQALLQDPTAAQGRVDRGRLVHLGLAGALERTIAALAPWLRTDPNGRCRASVRTASQRGDHVWADANTFSGELVALFDLAWWRRRGTVDMLGAGRGHMHKVADKAGSYLMRHYYRGGLMARVSRDLFLLQPVERSRAMQEFSLLRALRDQGLPVPRACAARYHRVAFFWYRADILVEQIADAVDVARLMHRQRALTAAEWQLLGQAVRQLHESQCFHSDLNCHNLMLGAHGQAWIVDFDKCGFRPGNSWKAGNLERLHRSLRKESRLDPDFRWDAAQWEDFLAGYQHIGPPGETR